MMPEVMSCLRRDLARFEPDFVLATGDICSHQTRDAMFAARDLMDSLSIPYYPMGGNHDFVVEHSREWFLEAFQMRIPSMDTVYSFAHKNLFFCVLDPWWKWSDDTLCPVSERAVAEKIDVSLKGARWAIPPHQFAWLEEELATHQDIPTIIASHYPAVPIPRRMRRPGIKDAGHLDNGNMLIEMLQAHPQVRAIFSGHVHMHFIQPINDGLTQVVTGALPEYPTEFREVRVRDKEMEIITHGLSDCTFAARSLIPGHDWTAGETCDRHTIINLA